MKLKKIFASAMTLALAFGLMACSKAEENKDGAKDTAKVEEKTEAKADDKDKDDKATENKSPIYAVKYNYLPEKFDENFRDEKKDLLTIEFGEKTNPAKKITVQLSDNQERFKGLFKMPENAENVKVGDKDGKFWDDGSFKYLVVDRDGYSIFTRSTLDKEETIKVVAEAK